MSTDELKQKLQTLIEQETDPQKLEAIYQFLSQANNNDTTEEPPEDLAEVWQRLKYHC